jgi:hypothetical protein
MAGLVRQDLLQCHHMLTGPVIVSRKSAVAVPPPVTKFQQVIAMIPLARYLHRMDEMETFRLFRVDPRLVYL